MTALPQSAFRPPRFRAPRGLLSARLIYVLLPLPIGLMVGLFSMLMGASPVYVMLQLLLFLLLIPAIYILLSDEKLFISIVLVSFIKIFFLSQIISIVVWHTPDANLQSAEMTETAMIVGFVSAIVGIAVARLLYTALPRRRSVLYWSPTPERLYRLGIYAGLIGFPAQTFWTIHILRETNIGSLQEGGGAPILAFLSIFSLLSMCCFAAVALIRSRGETFLSASAIGAIGLYFLLILPLATKTEPLRPIICLAVIAMMFRWRPRVVPIAIGLALFALVVEFFYPAITLARMTAYAEQEPTAVVFGEIALKSIQDPTEFAYIRDYTDGFELGGRQDYFGHVMGFWDRFTPIRTDQLVTGSRYVEPIGFSALPQAFYQILPQALGFKKDMSSQLGLEAAMHRSNLDKGKVGWENSGYVGDGFVAGGLPIVATYCFLFAFTGSLATRMIFRPTSSDILWVPLFVILMFAVADGSWVIGAYTYFWTWAIYVGGLFVLLRYMARRDPALLGHNLSETG